MEHIFKLRVAQSEWHQLHTYAESVDMTKSDVVRQALAAMGVITLADGAFSQQGKK